MTLKFIK